MNDTLINVLNTDFIKSDNIVNSSFNSKSCSCNCKCADICFCGIYCTDIQDSNVEYVNHISDIEDECMQSCLLNYIDDITHLKMELPKFRRFILNMHVLMGHLNFAELFREFQNGHYDLHGWVKEQLTISKLQAYKDLCKYIGPKQFTCLDCTMQKIWAKPKVKSSVPEATKPMELGYMDIYGPLPIGVHGEKYAVLYICKDSTFALCDFAKGRDFEKDIKPVLTSWRLDAREQKHKMEIIHTDSDPIFVSTKFQQWLKTLEINVIYAPPGQHWVNGYIERFIRTVSGNGKTMLYASGLPFKYWFYALKYAVFLHNIVQSRRLIKNPNYKDLSAYEIYYKEKFVDTIPIFGQLVISRNSDPGKLKVWETVGRECIFLGIDMSAHRAYTLLNKSTKMIIVSKYCRPVPNIYGWTMKSIVNDRDTRIVGRLEGLASSESASSAQLRKFEDAFAPSRSVPIVAVPQNSSLVETAVPHTLSGLTDFQNSLNENEVCVFQMGFYERFAGDQMMKETLMLLNVSLEYCNILDYYISMDQATSSSSVSLVTTVSGGVYNNAVDVKWVHNIRTTSVYYSDLSYDPTPLTEKDIELIQIGFADTEDHFGSLLQEINVLATKIKSRRSVKSKLVDGVLETIPRDYKEAMSPAFRDRYQAAIEIESNYKISYGVYSEPVLEFPANVRPLGFTWAFDIKTTPDGKFIKYTARLCTQGFDQEYMVNYWETYCPTVMKETLRVLFFLISNCGFTEYKFDVTKAFLNSPIDGVVWVVLPVGMPGYDANQRKYCTLLKGDYGTKQAMLCFEKMRHEVLEKEGYRPAIVDPCLYIKIHKPHLSFIGVHVDDFPCVSSDPTEPARLEESMRSAWLTTASPTIEKLLGLRVYRNPDSSLVIFNDTYFEELLLTIGLENLQPLYTIGNPKERYLPNVEARASEKMHALYRTLVGSSIWAAIGWRPDSNYKVGQLGRFVNNPSMEHLDAAIDLLRYYLTTRLQGLCFKRTGVPIPVPLCVEMLAWTDSDWSKDSDCVSISGYMISLQFPADIDRVMALPLKERCEQWPKYNVIAYSSKKQSTFVATSSEAAESRAVGDVAKPIKFLRDLLVEMTLMKDTDRPTFLLCDNNATIVNLHQGKVHAKNRHHARELAHAYSMVKNGVINPFKVATAHNHADIFTKILPRHQHDYHADWLMCSAVLPKLVPGLNQQPAKKARLTC